MAVPGEVDGQAVPHLGGVPTQQGGPLRMAASHREPLVRRAAAAKDRRPPGLIGCRQTNGHRKGKSPDTPSLSGMSGEGLS
jgi:hypothetical protein